MRFTVAAIVLLLSGCGAVIEPGHRGLLFDARRGGLGKEVLAPGYHRVGLSQRIEDFDVTYSTHLEKVHAISKEGLTIDLDLLLICRPIIGELYELDHEIGPHYYDEVIGPEFRSAVRGWQAMHSFTDLTHGTEAIEDEMEAATRRRTAGKHVEISSVVIKEVHYPPEVQSALQERALVERELVRKKMEMETELKKAQLEALIEERKAELRALERRLELQRQQKAGLGDGSIAPSKTEN